MEYKFKTPIEVMDHESGSYIPVDSVTITFRGKKGLKAIKGLQDVIFTALQSTPKGNDTASPDEGAEINPKDLLAMLAFTGQSETMFDRVLESIKNFSDVGGSKLTEANYDNDMSIEDLEGLYDAVMLDFLLPGITLRLNNTTR